MSELNNVRSFEDDVSCYTWYSVQEYLYQVHLSRTGVSYNYFVRFYDLHLKPSSNECDDHLQLNILNLKTSHFTGHRIG